MRNLTLVTHTVLLLLPTERELGGLPFIELLLLLLLLRVRGGVVVLVLLEGVLTGQAIERP